MYEFAGLIGKLSTNLRTNPWIAGQFHGLENPHAEQILSLTWHKSTSFERHGFTICIKGRVKGGRHNLPFAVIAIRMLAMEPCQVPSTASVTVQICLYMYDPRNVQRIRLTRP